MSHATRRRLSAAAIALTCTAVAACGSTDEAAAPAPRISTAYALPNDRAYPEGIAVDARTGDTYVGSYTNGSVYRAARGAARAEIFLPEGADGRQTANGLEVDRAGRLWVTDSTAGVTVYDTATRAAIARFDVPGTAARFVNDLAITPDGTAYLTDSARSVVYRVTTDQLADAVAHGGRAELTPHCDLSAVVAQHDPNAFTLNGIAADPAGRYLLTVDMNAGELFRIPLAPNATDPIRKVTLHGGDLTHGDGLELHDNTLWVAQNTINTISRWAVTEDGTAATRNSVFTDESLGLPTTLVRTNNQTLVVASQFDKGGPMGPGTPKPFTVLAVDGI
ncbi:SMP-30/gluconolactonase/LRE family protein [Nocardia altamirensis]|uniref:SMP-30/gluconolactonase/LRE family protein n=1 Tax=Nocardia altamirensis TaxID=472158 RepID=UPI00083FDC92|nr:superoxide dismutase [Nocardia altamirensis]